MCDPILVTGRSQDRSLNDICLEYTYEELKQVETSANLGVLGGGLIQR